MKISEKKTIWMDDLKALGHPQRPQQTPPWGEQQVPFIFIKMNI